MKLDQNKVMIALCGFTDELKLLRYFATEPDVTEGKSRIMGKAMDRNTCQVLKYTREDYEAGLCHENKIGKVDIHLIREDQIIRVFDKDDITGIKQALEDISSTRRKTIVGFLQHLINGK